MTVVLASQMQGLSLDSQQKHTQRRQHGGAHPPRAGGAMRRKPGVLGSACLAESMRDLVSNNRQGVLVHAVSPGTLQAQAAGYLWVQEFQSRQSSIVRPCLKGAGGGG